MMIEEEGRLCRSATMFLKKNQCVGTIARKFWGQKRFLKKREMGNKMVLKKFFEKNGIFVCETCFLNLK